MSSYLKLGWNLENLFGVDSIKQPHPLADVSELVLLESDRIDAKVIKKIDMLKGQTQHFRDMPSLNSVYRAISISSRVI